MELGAPEDRFVDFAIGIFGEHRAEGTVSADRTTRLIHAASLRAFIESFDTQPAEEVSE